MTQAISPQRRTGLRPPKTVSLKTLALLRQWLKEAEANDEGQASE
jgi:hypothetical protein